MATTEFIFQGFTAKTHRQAIERLFDVPDIERVIVSVAFVNRRGVDLLEMQLAAHCARTTAFIGVRNEITSVQGATRLLNLGVSLFVVDTAWRAVVFHPKLYLARGKNHARLVVGSANLTAGGLNNNIEASVAIDLDLKDANDKALVESIEQEFGALAHDHPLHVLAITNVSELDDLLANGRLIDERAARPLRLTSSTTPPASDSLPRIKLKVDLLPSPPVPASQGPKSAATAKPTSKNTKGAVAPPSKPVASGFAYERVWGGKLSKRDLTIPDGTNTHPTGSMNFDKGLLANGVDYHRYFRDEVFSHLAWTPGAKPNIEEAHGSFQLVLKGIGHGEFDLLVAHSTNKAMKTYKQANAVTRLRWGTMRKHISRPDLVGRTITLYRDSADPKRFVIEID